MERGEELEPPLDSRILVPHFANAFQCLVVGDYVEVGSPKVASGAFESPNDGAGFQIKRSPMPLRVERSSADKRDEFHGTVRLLLLEGGANPSMQASQYTWNGREPSATASHLGKTRIGGVTSSARISVSVFP